MPLTSLAAWKMVKLPSGRGPEAGPPAPCHRLGCSRAPPPHAPISPLLATQVSRSCACTTTTWRRCQRSTRPTSPFSSSTRTASPRSPRTTSSRPPRWRDSSCRGAPHRRTTAAPPRHRTAPQVQGKGRAGPGPQTCGVARGAYAKGEAGARSAAVLQVSAIQAHALGGVLLVVHDEPPLPQREAPRHLRTAAARRRGRPLEGRRLERVGRRRVVWTRRFSLGLGLRAAIHPCARQHLPQQRGREVALLSPWPLARTRQARDGGTSARRRTRARWLLGGG